ncbi:MAG TPA: transcription elongation factor [Flavobacteriaceae bacterium]|jgi:transcription elongation GreA/GreB family factor
MNIKQELLQVCTDYVNKRIYNYKLEMDTIKDSIENNDKGNSEDDDSGNGKLLNDLEKNAQHLNDATKLMETLKQINPKIQNESGTLGSIVYTQTNVFFLSVSVGKIELEGSNYFAISLQSPIGMLLKNKTKGDQINFNGTSYTITDII